MILAKGGKALEFKRINPHQSQEPQRTQESSKETNFNTRQSFKSGLSNKVLRKNQSIHSDAIKKQRKAGRNTKPATIVIEKPPVMTEN